MLRFIFGIICLLAVSSMAELNNAKAKELGESCKANFPTIKEFPSFEDLMGLDFETNDPKMKCYIHCIAEGLGEVDKDGKLILSAIKALGLKDEAKVTAAVNECIKIVGQNACETSYQQYGCLEDKLSP